jgi:erythromycin esterase
MVSKISTMRFNWFVFLCVIIINGNVRSQSDVIELNHSVNFKSSSKISDSIKKDIQLRSKPINSLTSINFDDLNFISNVIDTTSHILLGESSHYIGEYNSLRVRLIKYFHEELGYNVLAFEAPFSNLNFVSQNRDFLDVYQMLRLGLYPIMHCEELLDLMTYLKQHPDLKIVGFDCQEKNIDSLVIGCYSQKIQQMDSLFKLNYQKIIQTFKEQCKKLAMNQNESFLNTNDSLVKEVEILNSALIENQINDVDLLFHMKNIKQSIQYRSELAKGVFSNAMIFRDSLMAENLIEILKLKYPTSKAIVWGHNAHLSNKSIYMDYPKPMGEFLNQKLNTYSIGLYAYSGNFGRNTKAIKIKKPKKYNLEFLLHENRMPISFIDLKSTSNSKWLFETFKTLNTSHGVMSIIPATDFDAIIFFDKVNKPKYINTH